MAFSPRSFLIVLNLNISSGKFRSLSESVVRKPWEAKILAANILSSGGNEV